jgi:symplekin
MAATVADTLTQLEAARHLALSDATHYAMIVPGILPIVGAQAHLDIRRWGADFLTEAFASPALTFQAKEGLSIQPGGEQNKGLLLRTLRELLEFPGQDTGVLKSVIQIAASIYGLVFRYMYVFLCTSS